MGLEGWWAATQLEQLTQHATGGAVWLPDWFSGSMMAVMFTSPLNHEVKRQDTQWKRKGETRPKDALKTETSRNFTEQTKVCELDRC